MTSYVASSLRGRVNRRLQHIQDLAESAGPRQHCCKKIPLNQYQADGTNDRVVICRKEEQGERELSVPLNNITARIVIRKISFLIQFCRGLLRRRYRQRPVGQSLPVPPFRWRTAL
jgi:hypothetical protein